MPKTQRVKASTDEGSALRGRNRERTLQELQLALHRLQRTGAKITLKSVAVEANVSPPLINNRYPDFAEEVRAINGSPAAQRKSGPADPGAGEEPQAAGSSR